MADKVVITIGVGNGAMLRDVMALIGKGGRVVHTSVAPMNDTEVTLNLFDLTLLQKQLVGLDLRLGQPPPRHPPPAARCTRRAR